MLRRGLLQEVKSLIVNHQLSRQSIVGKAIGYAQTIDYLASDPLLNQPARFVSYVEEFQASVICGAVVRKGMFVDFVDFVRVVPVSMPSDKCPG